jgi:hypothetical protein
MQAHHVPLDFHFRQMVSMYSAVPVGQLLSSQNASWAYNHWCPRTASFLMWPATVNPAHQLHASISHAYRLLGFTSTANYTATIFRSFQLPAVASSTCSRFSATMLRCTVRSHSCTSLPPFLRTWLPPSFHTHTVLKLQSLAGEFLGLCCSFRSGPFAAVLFGE